MKRHILIFILAILSFWNREASAFWGSDATDSSSGLNVAAGFDVNTITTLTGTVMTLPERKGQEQHTVMSVAAPQGAVTVVLGPWWYWEKQTINTTKNQEIAITGSLAQGKDGAIYVFAQRLENRSTGEVVTLRSESGKPLWSRSGSGNQNGIRQHGGSGPRSGSGNRGSGMRGGRR
ncbi:MAG: hypothetical protein H7X83_07985 [Verrucomicrobia bacterium]|nr:hypothetical protein [Deltaproteobacteria bacterium]